MSNITLEQVTKTLSKYTPCDVSDGLVKNGIKNGGYFPNLLQRSGFSDTSVVGPAYTVLFAPIDDPRPALLEGYIDAVPRGSIVTIGLTKDLQTEFAPYVKVNNALFGGLMSTRAQYLHAVGAVVFGRIRDIKEHRNLNFPVFSYGVGSTAGQPVVKLVGVNVPLDIKVANYPEPTWETINPNDVIVADENGVVRLPTNNFDLVEKVLTYVPQIVEADELVANDIKNGKPAGASQKLHRSQIRV